MDYNLIKKFSLEKLEKIFFALFLLSVPVQMRLTIYTAQTFSNSVFNEYATFFLYLSDMLFIITLLVYFVNTLTFKSFFTITKRLFHTYPRIIPSFTLLITLVTWSFMGILWSEYKNLTFYQSLKILELALLFLYTRERLQWFGINKLFTLVFITGTLESLIGITQYYLQRSIGLGFLMESVLSPDTPNVAKIVVESEKIIRAYGTFPHPNVFSGFLILSIFCGIWLLFSHKISINANISKTTINTNDTIKIVSRETILILPLVLGTIIQLTAFILTFSRISWLVLIFIIFTLIFLLIGSKLFHVKQFVSFSINRRTIFLLTGIIIPLIFIINTNWKQISNRSIFNENNYKESIDNRVLYNNIAINIFRHYPITGIGNKNFTVRMQEFTSGHLEIWQFQPVHNIYLLILSETGLFGLAIFLAFLYAVLKPIQTNAINNETEIVSRVPSVASTEKKPSGIQRNKEIVSRETIYMTAKEGETILLKSSFLALFAGLLIIGLFDHYFWTLQQGQLTFWLVLGVIASLSSKK